MKKLLFVFLCLLTTSSYSQTTLPTVENHLLGEYLRVPNEFSSVKMDYTGPTVHYLTAGSSLQLSSNWTVRPNRPGALSTVTRYFKLSRTGLYGAYYKMENNSTTTPPITVEAGVYTFRITREFIYNNPTVSADFDTVFYKDITVIVKPNSNTWAYAGNDTLIYEDMESKYMIGGKWVATAPQKIILDARASTGDTSWTWTKTKAPAGDTSTILNSKAQVTEVSGIRTGTYEFTLTMNGSIVDRMNVIYRNKKYEYMAAECRTGSPVVHVLPPSTAATLAANGQYYASWNYPYVAKFISDNTGQTLKGGDHIVLNAERSPGVPIDSVTKVWLDGFGGRKECPVVVRTQTKVPIVMKGDGSTMVFGGGDQLSSSCVYFTVDGTYWRGSGTPYSFRFDNRSKMAQTAVPTQVTPLSFDFASSFTFKGFRSIGGGSIKLKMEAQMRPPRQLRFFSYDSIVLSDIWQSRVNNEGYYVLSTASEGTKPDEQYSTPPRGKHIQLKNILIDSTLWDGLQITNCHKDALVENVFSWRTGKEDAYGQNMAINFGGTIQGKVMNNVVKDCHGKAISAHTNALDKMPTEITGNVIDSVGHNLATGVFESDAMLATGSNAYPEYIGWGTVNIHNNVITMRSNTKSAITLAYLNGIGMNASSIVNNNIFVHPTAVRLNRYAPGTGPIAVGFNDQVSTPHTGNYGTFNRTFKWTVIGVEETATGYKIKGTINDTYKEWTSIAAMNTELRKAAGAKVNTPPVIEVQVETEITLPVDYTTIIPMVSDVDNDALSYQWTKVSTLEANLTAPVTSKNLGLTSLVEGLHSFQLLVSDGTDTASQIFVVRVLPKIIPVNLPPLANAVATTTRTPDVVNLVGEASDPEGGMFSFHWKQLTGPAGAQITDTTAKVTVVTKLVTGTYLFGFTVTDDKGAIAADSVLINVVIPPVESSKYVKVNLFGGVNPYTNLEWNNWNVSSSLNTGLLKYSDASASVISAQLSKSSGINDNGTKYGSGMAPAEVLRYASNATTSRTLTLSGLSAGKTYNLELYASRSTYSGNYTNFIVNGAVQSVSTYKNLQISASFTGLTADATGKIIVTIANAQAYNYLNGFVLTEVSTSAAPLTPTVLSNSTPEATGAATHKERGSLELVADALQVKALPNPTNSYFTIRVSSKSTVPVKLSLVDALGNVVEQYQNVAPTTPLTMGRNLRPGTYFLEGVQGKEVQRLKLIKTGE